MSELTKKSKYIISSSDSEISDEDDESTTTSCIPESFKSIYSSKHLHKRTRALSRSDVTEDYQLYISLKNSSNLTNINQQITTTDNLSQINNINFETSSNVHSNSNHSSENNDDKEEQSNVNDEELSTIDEQQSNLNEEKQSNINLEQESTSNKVQFHEDHTELPNITTCTNTTTQQNNNIQLISTTTIVQSNILNDSHTQTCITKYFPASENSFKQINDLNETKCDFRIRCKILSICQIRYFASNNKVYDAIVCDCSGEIKIVAFNEEANRFYNSIKINQKITIENGEVQKANSKFCSPYSSYEIRLLPYTIIQPYEYVEGIVLMDRGTITTDFRHNVTLLKRRSLKIKDETAAVNVTIWNEKIDEIPETVVNKRIRIRNGKTNHYNDYVSINVSGQAIIQFY